MSILEMAILPIILIVVHIRFENIICTLLRVGLGDAAGELAGGCQVEYRTIGPQQLPIISTVPRSYYSYSPIYITYTPKWYW